MSALGNVGIIAGREVRERLRGKSFYLSTALIVIGVLLAGVLFRVFGDEVDEATLVIAGDTPAGFEELVTATGESLEIEIDIETAPADEVERARTRLADGDVDAVLVPADRTVLYYEREDTTLQAALEQAWSTAQIASELGDAGLSSEQIESALSPEALEVDLLDTAGGALAVLVGMFAGVLLFLSVQMYGGYILIGVVEEKSTAVMEVLLARVRATEMLAGKVLGIGLVAVAQFSALVVASVVSLFISGIDVPGDVWAAVPWTAVWFVAGFAMYAFLFAMAGAMVSRQEDAQSAAVPVYIVLVTAYMSVFLLAGVPGSTATRVMSLIPLSAPLVMPTRIAAGEVHPVEVVVSLLIVAATTYGLIQLSARIYNRLVLRRGARVGWLEALRSSS